jgi:glycosyltransferase involved in cell wall biosynthesis
MSVIWIINQYGGIPKYGIHGRHYQFSKRLANDGHKVFLFSANHHHHLNISSEEAGPRAGVEPVHENFCMVWVKTFKYTSSQSWVRFFNWCVFALGFLIFRPKELQKPDIIYYSSLSLVGTLTAELLSRFYKVPYFFEERDIWPLTLNEINHNPKFKLVSKFFQYLEDRAYKNACLVISPIRGVKKHMQKRGIKNKEFLWLPNGCEEPAKIELSERELEIINEISKLKFVVGYAGSMGSANRVDILLKAAKNLNNNSCINIVLIGGGALAEAHKKFIYRENLKNVRIYNRVSRYALFEAYKHFDICYIGWGNYAMYDYGTSANKISEYMFAAKPILQSYSGGFDSVIDGQCGVTVKAEDHEAVAFAIKKFENMGSNEIKIKSNNSLAYANEHFRYEEIYKNLKKKIEEKLK